MSISTINVDLQSEGDENSRNQFAFEETASSFEEKTYLYGKIKVNFSKTSYLIMSAIICILLILIIVIIVAYNSPHSEAAKKSEDPSLTLLRSIIISSDNNLWAFDGDNKTYKKLQTTENEIITFDTYSDKTLFWTESNASSFSSWRNYSLKVPHTKKWKPQAIAVDYVTEKLYLIDKSSETLNVIDVKSNYYGVVISDLQNPQDLVLDPAEGLIFILEFSKGIIKANMDGTSARRIIESQRIMALTVDRKASRIYWANDETTIESCDYNGYGRTLVTSIPMGIVSLTVFENQLFWTRSSNFSDICPCTNIIWSCALFRRACYNITSYRLGFDRPKIARTSFDQHRHLIGNPCELNNGGCEQLCLLTARGSHDCACNTGWKIKPDGKSCGNATDLMLYVQGAFIRARYLNEDREAFNDVIVPTRYQKVKLAKKPLIHFDYDMVTGDFFLSDDHHIFRINLMRDDEQTVIHEVSEDYKIRDLAYDWIKGCLYYVKESQDPAKNHSIEMISIRPDRVGKLQQKTILTSKYKKEHYIACPFFLVIHPNHEYLFYSEYNGVNDNLQRVGTNGKGLRLIKPLYDFMYNLLAIDLDKARLYWTTTADPTLVKSVNLDGTEEKNIQMRFMSNPMFIGVHGDWMHVANFTEIWRVHAETGENATRVVRLKVLNEQTVFVHGLGIYNLASRTVT